MPINFLGNIVRYQNLINFTSMRNNLFILAFSLVSFYLKSQNFVPGQVYYGTDSLIEYRAGNLPIILSAPHGGYETPACLPDRNCSGCVTIRDSYTQELTREIEGAIKFHTGCYPHVIINKLHRKKLDANRDMIEATDSNLVTEPYWHDYMNYCDTAKKLIYDNFPQGIFFDIHGHGHTLQRLELGYLISGTNLRKNDSSLNTSPISSKTSILNLKFSNLNSYSHAKLIRGEHSFGGMIERKGFDAVPSDSIPFPLLGEPFFNGGYNTKRFGSYLGGTIDAIQIESHSGVRFNATNRARYDDSLAKTMLEYLEKHYFLNFSNGYCNYLSSLEEIKNTDILIFPNPTSGLFKVKGIPTNSSYQILSPTGQLVKNGTISDQGTIDIQSMSKGLYILTIEVDNLLFTKKIIKE